MATIKRVGRVEFGTYKRHGRGRAVHVASRGELRAEAPTKAEASRKLEDMIDAALEGSYTPIFLEWRGDMFAVIRGPQEWHYRIIRGSEDRSRGDVTQSGANYGWRTRGEAADAARSHLISNHLTGDERTAADLPAWCPESAVSGLLDRARWIRAFQAYKAERPDLEPFGAEMHRLLCETYREPRFD